MTFEMLCSVSDVCQRFGILGRCLSMQITLKNKRKIQIDQLLLVDYSIRVNLLVVGILFILFAFLRWLDLVAPHRSTAIDIHRKCR